MWSRSQAAGGGEGGIVGAINCRYQSPNYFFTYVTAETNQTVYISLAASSAVQTVLETEFVRIEKTTTGHSFRLTYLDDCFYSDTNGKSNKTKNTYDDFTAASQWCSGTLNPFIYK